MQRVDFSTDDLPAHFDESARIAYWRNFSDAYYGKLDVEKSDGRPFAIRFSYVPFGQVGLGEFRGTIMRSARPGNPAMSGTLVLGVNLGEAPFLVRDAGQENWLAPRSMILLAGSDRGELRAKSDMAWMSLCVPYAQLAERVASAGDLIGQVADSAKPATQHLFRYLDILRGRDVSGGTDEVNARIGGTVLDLVALAFGEAHGPETAGARGLRSARTQFIMREIRKRFAEPGFSAVHVSREIGVTQRYVQDLLHETGATFTERVNELRLQKARAMLLHPANDALKISEIVLACGFSDVSYFNRCFRKRFGCSPTQYRGGR